MTENKTKKDWILSSLERMDIGMLELLLCDTKTYHDATKDIFLEKLQEAFARFRKQGNTFLTKHEGTCMSNHCNNNGCSGYTFVGNTTGACLNWIIKETDDDIEDMFYCSGFKRSDGQEQEGEYIFLDILDDEKASFVPSEPYLILSHFCRMAVEELLQRTDNILTPSVYGSWLQKHKRLYTSLPKPFYAYRDKTTFQELYDKMNHIYTIFLHFPKVRTALDEWYALHQDNENEVMRWLFRYQELARDVYLHADVETPVDGQGADVHIRVHNRRVSAYPYMLAAGIYHVHDNRYWQFYETNAIFRRRVRKLQKMGWL